MNLVFRLLLIFLCMTLSSCNLDWLTKKREDINNIYSDLYLLDVNDPDLYNDARIAGAINVSYDDLNERAKKLNKNFDIIIYCSDYACTESDRAAKLLRSLGFNNVLAYHGGIQEWYQLYLKDRNKFPIEGPATKEFLTRPINKFEREPENSISSNKLSELLMARKI